MKVIGEKELREVLISAVDFLRSKHYLHNGDVIIACAALTKMIGPDHNMIITTKPMDDHTGDPA